jgi:hypothetical protein
MDDLDIMNDQVERLRDRVVSAAVFVASAASASLVVSDLRQYFVLVSVGAAVWLLVEGIRLRSARSDRDAALDQLVLTGSRDPRCERRRLVLGSPQLHHRLAGMLRQTCDQAHCYTPGALWLVDRQAVHAVEHDLRELARVFDRDAGRLPPAAVALVRYLLWSRLSPLYDVHLDPQSKRRAVQATQRIVARCRAELEDHRSPALADPPPHQTARPSPQRGRG